MGLLYDELLGWLLLGCSGIVMATGGSGGGSAAEGRVVLLRAAAGCAAAEGLEWLGGGWRVCRHLYPPSGPQRGMRQAQGNC